MEFSAKQIAELLNGEIIGDPEAKVSSISKIEEGKAGTLSFLANPKYTRYIYTTESSIVLINKDFEPEKEISATLIKVQDAYQAFAALLEIYNQYKANKSGISKSAVIEDSAKLGSELYIAANVYIGEHSAVDDNTKIYPNSYIGDNVSIGKNVTIYSGVNIYSESVIRDNCIIHSGVVIGSDGFGFAPKSEEEFQKVPQIGNVVIEENVEIGSNTSIDRATLGSTIIRKGVKLDNLIQIAHNVEIGENTVMAAQCGVSGTTKIGKNCMIGGQVGFAGHLIIGDNVKIGAQSGIIKNVKSESVIQGSPAINYRDFFKITAYSKLLPEMKKQLDMLQKKIDNI